MADNLVEAMQPQLRDRFMQLKGDNASYRSEEGNWGIL